MGFKKMRPCREPQQSLSDLWMDEFGALPVLMFIFWMCEVFLVVHGFL